ncbi:hypothetical protein IJ579_03740 [bacterium]|nr:hypothetical protein [bacterium]
MSDEEKKECTCDCHKIAAKFLLLTLSSFVGTLLAIIFAALLLKPVLAPCPCHKGMHKMPPRMERQLTPQAIGHRQFDMQKGDFKGARPQFQKGKFPQRPQGEQKAPQAPERK